MNLTEAKSELKKKGYSIVTIYTPNKDKIEIHILKNNVIINWCIGYPEDCSEYLIKANAVLTS